MKQIQADAFVFGATGRPYKNVIVREAQQIVDKALRGATS